MKDEKGNLFSEVHAQVMMSPVRFPIVILLAMYEEVDFTFIKKELKMSDGNLGANLKKLELQKLISSRKMFVGAKPKTLYKITKEGKSQIYSFIEIIKKVEGAITQ